MIWISPGSEHNEIVGNAFEDIADAAVVVEGDSNRVALDDPADAVRDLGQGNSVSSPGGSASPAAPPVYESEFLEANGIRTLESGRLNGRMYDAAALWRGAGFEPGPHRGYTTAAQEASDEMDW